MKGRKGRRGKHMKRRKVGVEDMKERRVEGEQNEVKGG